MSTLSTSFLTHGFLTGLAVAAPVGPVSILCIQRSIEKGFVSGFTSALGASTGDVIYAFMSAFGLSFVVDDLIDQKIWLSLIGGVFLCYLGTKTFLTKPAVCINQTAFSTRYLTAHSKGVGRRSYFLKDYATTLMLDLINPMTILPFVAALAGLHTTNNHSLSLFGGLFVLGVFISAMLWRTSLSLAANWFRGGFKPDQLQSINRISGIIMIGFGCIAIYSGWS